jgi:phosphatidylglycerol:prolipoprotein diacylglycerol transferase
MIVALVYGQRRRLQFWSALDAMTPLFATLAVGLGLAHLASGSAFGRETTLPWGIPLWGALRHPSQVYEILAALTILALLLLRKPDSRPGILFLIFASTTSAARLFLEAFRGDSTLVVGGLRLAQIIAWIILSTSLLLIEVRMRGTANEERPRTAA